MANEIVDVPEVETDIDVEEDEDEVVLPSRAKDISRKKPIREQLLPIFAAVEQGFTDQVDRANDIQDYWDIYNCKLGPKQFYSGNSKIFVPIVHNAVEARVTRFVNQIFPPSGRWVEAISENADLPQATTALVEHYVRKAKLRTQVVPAMIRNGDVEGHYTVYVDWFAHTRNVAMRVKQAPTTPDGIPIPEAPEVDDIVEEKISDAYPTVDVIADTDVLILPATADSVTEALAMGGSVTILRRWTKPQVEKLAREGAIDKEGAKQLILSMTKKTDVRKYDKKKEATDAAGVKTNDSGVKYALVYETWTELVVDKERRLCVAYYGGETNIVGCRLNPIWSDRCPVISVPVKKVQGSFKGLSPTKFCADIQYQANDATNEGMDSAAFSLMPIVMTDPEKNPRISSMVLALAAVWETSPNDTQFAEFPQLWTQALEIVAAATAQIATTLSVSPAAITQQTSAKKLDQAEVANEQQVDILTTADAVTVIADGILTPVISLMIELDHQYREDEILVRQYGEMGVRAQMEKIPPLQMDRRWQFRWFGVEAAQSAQLMQQQVAGMNVLRGIPPQAYPGYQLNLAPLMTQVAENLFGPRLAPLIFVDLKSQLSLDPMFENSLLTDGIDMQVHPLDNDAEHMQAHMQLLMKLGGDPTGVIRVHLERHKLSMQQKIMAQMQATMQAGGAAPPGAPGVPGGAVGGQAQPGVAGTPRIGAQPGGPRPNGQGPPGMVHRDQLKDPRAAPRE